MSVCVCVKTLILLTILIIGFVLECQLKNILRCNLVSYLNEPFESNKTYFPTVCDASLGHEAHQLLAHRFHHISHHLLLNMLFLSLISQGQKWCRSTVQLGLSELPKENHSAPLFHFLALSSLRGDT